MVEAAVVGRKRAILERLKYWMESALDDNNYDIHTVSLNRDILVNKIKNMPLITISLGTSFYNSEVYDRLYPDKGMTAVYPFTLFIYHWRTKNTEYNHNYDVHILTDLIVKYLRSKSGNAVEKTTHGIQRIENIDVRESDPMGIFNLTRMIISGNIVVIRGDSP